MRERIREAADKNGRSMNSEILERLDRSFYENTEYNFLSMLAESKFIQKVLPPGLYGRIQTAAERHSRSVEEEVVQALETAFPPPTADELISVWEQLLEPFSTFRPPSTEERRRERELLMTNIRTMVEYFKEERAAGRGGDLKRRFHEEFEADEQGFMRRR